jgi:hypothetical protein
VQELSDRPPLFMKTIGKTLSVDVLTEAAANSAHLARAFDSGKLAGRIERGLAAFFSGMRAEHVDDSILCLQRSLEGLVQPSNKQQFVKRMSALIDPVEQSVDDVNALLTEIYDVRSELTHAAPPEVAFKTPDRKAAEKRARELQAALYLVAATAYSEVLRNPQLIDKFSREGLGEYWGRITAAKRAPPFRIRVDLRDLASRSVVT